MAVIKRVSLVDQVYEKLRERIVQLKIPFGSKLNVSKLQEEYGVSSTPVREALNRLLNEGLIEFENNVGARVIDITPDDVRQIQEISFAYQMLAARNALRNGDADQMSEEIGQYIEEYRSSTSVVESCRCIRNIMDVFYKNSHNEMLLVKITSMTGMDEILHSLLRFRGKRAEAEASIIPESHILNRFMRRSEKKIFPVCVMVWRHISCGSREYIIKNLETVKRKSR
ncbi:MAG: GntR family transcriptional regulator [Eubacterium sp.]